MGLGFALQSVPVHRVQALPQNRPDTEFEMLPGALL